jgi:hypothetical protein
MPPDAMIDAPVLYSVFKYLPVIDLIRSLDPSNREEITGVMDDLQFDPRPPGHKPMALNSPYLTFTVEGTQPKYLLVYTVDDNQSRIEVLALQETVSRA